jgi:uncharacterized protein (TIGR03790 family)
MRRLLLALLPGISFAAPIPPDANSVVVLYNSAIPESRQVAEFYRDNRAIPAENLIGLNLPKSDDISRAEYNTTLLEPLRAEFEKRHWWKRAKTRDGNIEPTECRMRVLVNIFGVPLRIKPEPAPAPDPSKPAPSANAQALQRDEASVDSELAVFGVTGLPIAGPLNNPYFQKDEAIIATVLPALILVGRIDGPNAPICQRMILDAVTAERTGLWGRAYIDIAKKFDITKKETAGYAEGDQWLENIIKANRKTGIPTVADRFPDTYPTNYPMTDAALYYGWYEWNVNGPFLNPRFRFRTGAVAMHLHSFSAEQIRNPNHNWSAALLSRGAAATIGNVYEPYLQATHHFDILHDRLLKGYTLIEAAWMSMPVVSWQGVVFGDPLYRPFLHLDGGGERKEEDNDYRALRLGALRWSDSAERSAQLKNAAERTHSGILQEAVALEDKEAGHPELAAREFEKAREFYHSPSDRARQDFHIITLDREASRREDAAKKLHEAATRYEKTPEAVAINAWIAIVDPPPPPAADPTKSAPASK